MDIGRRQTDGYVRNARGKQVYPKPIAFAVDPQGNQYYARDAAGHEHYPLYKKKSLLIKREGRLVLARYTDGSLRYPTDHRGNEYYLREEGRPYLLRRDDGTPYLAQNRRGHELIPWNHLSEFVSNKPLVFTRDAAENLVYLDQTTLPPWLGYWMKFMCNVCVICPKMSSCMMG